MYLSSDFDSLTNLTTSTLSSLSTYLSGFPPSLCSLDADVNLMVSSEELGLGGGVKSTSLLEQISNDLQREKVQNSDKIFFLKKKVKIFQKNSILLENCIANVRKCLDFAARQAQHTNPEHCLERYINIGEEKKELSEEVQEELPEEGEGEVKKEDDKKKKKGKKFKMNSLLSKQLNFKRP